MGILFRWARFLAHHRWFVVAAWLAILLVAAPLAKNVTHNLSSSGFEDPSSQSAWVDTQLSHLVSVSGGPATYLVEHSTTARVRAWAVASGLPARTVYKLAASNASVLIPPHGKTVSPAKVLAAESAFRKKAKAGGATVTTVSDAAVGQKVTQGARTTLGQSLPLALPVLLILLLLVFGSVASAALPLLVAAVGAVLALGVLDLLENVMTLSSYLTDIVSFLALGVGVDYALFISMRFRSERDARSDPDHAVAETMRHAGRSVLYSGIAVALALSALLLGGNAYWQGIAVGGAVAVASVLATTHTLLPALIRIAGRRLDWGRVPVLGRGRLWTSVADVVERHPIWALLLGVAILGTPAWFGRYLIIRTPANLAV
ncbi:MAG: MMPL family transporter, partial [Clostridia bacterium]